MAIIEFLRASQINVCAMKLKLSVYKTGLQEDFSKILLFAKKIFLTDFSRILVSFGFKNFH